MWNRRQDSGKSVAGIFAAMGLPLTKSVNDRETGWYAVKEYLQIKEGKSRLKIFTNCVNLIRTLPALTHDDKNVNDVANTPHELTHRPDALRYFCVMHRGNSRIQSVFDYNEAESLFEMTDL